MTALLYLYLLGAPVAFALVLRKDRREQPWLPWVDSLLIAFAGGVFWPVLACFMLVVVVLLFARDRRNGAP